MTDFCPDGYLRTYVAIAVAAQHWFAERLATLEDSVTPLQGEESSIEKAVRIFSQPPIPENWRQAFQKITNETVYRLRDLLHRGKLKSYYFNNDGPQAVSREFWATADADGVLESGTFWPFGPPSRIYEQRPNYPLFLLESKLNELFSEELPQEAVASQVKNS